MNFLYLISTAIASDGTSPEVSGSIWHNLMPLLIIVLIFYFVLIRPQQKKAREHKEMINNLKKGDNVITSGGILGSISRTKGNIVVLKIADDVEIKVRKETIIGITSDELEDA